MVSAGVYGKWKTSITNMHRLLGSIMKIKLDAVDISRYLTIYLFLLSERKLIGQINMTWCEGFCYCLRVRLVLRTSENTLHKCVPLGSPLSRSKSYAGKSQVYKVNDLIFEPPSGTSSSFRHPAYIAALG